MDRNAFWKIIDDAREATGDIEQVPDEVVSQLCKLPIEEIISFKQHQLDLEAESYRWDLWAVAYIINGGCSDDGFDYFRAWLLANGRARFEAAMQQPEVIGDWTDGDADLEDMLAVAYDAYRRVGDQDSPFESTVDRRPAEPVGEAWDEDDLESLYPRLCEKFWG